MKLAITGKGGVGKTTVSALIARFALGRGNRVVAIDADPDANLAPTLGHPDPSAIIPLSERRALIEERVGSGGVIRLNPKVDDLVATVGVDVDGITLMNLGTIPRGGGGCFCAPSSLLKAFLRHALSQPDEWVILDMEAGLEHLGRGSSSGVDLLVIVVEPTARSTETAGRIRLLARDLGIVRIGLVANKADTAEELDAIRAAVPGVPLLGAIPRSAALAAFNARVSLEKLEPQVREAVASLYDSLVSA